MQTNPGKRNVEVNEASVMPMSSSRELVSNAPKLSLFAITRRIAIAWRPQQIPIPIVDPNLENLSPFERVAEVLRYHLLCFEYWISSGGILREYFRFNLGLFVFMAIPAILFLPAITIVLNVFAGWAILIREMVVNLLIALICIIIIVAILFLIRIFVQKTREVKSKSTNRRSP